MCGFIFWGTSKTNMAALSGSRGDRLSASTLLKSSLTSPEKVREILNEGLSLGGTGATRSVDRKNLQRMI